MDLAEINQQFGLEGILRFVEAKGDLIAAHITTTAGEAEIYLHGAHVTAWKPAENKEVLFTSEKSIFAIGTAIRGGVPVIFPWFGPRDDGKTGPSHGFARTSVWDIRGSGALEDGRGEIVLGLKPSDVSRGLGYDHFDVEYRVTVGTTLEMELIVVNQGQESMRIQDALHTYFSVGDVQQIGIAGLQGTTYADKIAGGERKVQADDLIRFIQTRDQVHVDTESTCEIEDPVLKRRIVVQKTGSKSTVVWNPWIEGAKSLKDLGDEEWERFVCVETANTLDNTIMLPAGETRRMKATLSVKPL